MYGDKAFELILELKRAAEGSLPPYNVRVTKDAIAKQTFQISL